MIGGKVIEVADVPDRPNVIFVDVRDKYDTCAILVERNKNSERIEIGDSLWWQGGWAMWTPQANTGSCCNSPDNHPEVYSCKGGCGVRYDIKMPRVGYSGVLHPSRKEQEQ